MYSVFYYTQYLNSPNKKIPLNKESLIEAEKESKKLSAKDYKTFDELLEELGFPKRSEEEQQRIDKILEKINKKISKNYNAELEAILSDE